MEANPLPDPRPRKPKLSLPAGACDCHAHVFEARELYPLKPDAGYEPAPAPFTQYLKMLHTVGCSRAVLVQPSPYGTDNSAMVHALRSGDFPLRGIALIDDKLTDRQLEELHHYGVQGARIHLGAANAGIIVPSLPAIAERIRRYGWHLQFYVDVAGLPEVDRVLTALPVPVVIDHFGLVPASGGTDSIGFKTMLRLAQSKRCWFKLSAPYRISQQPPGFSDVTPLARALVAAAPDRCVWGSDWPHPNASFMPNDGDEVDLLATWIPDEKLRHQVLVENPAELYGF